MVTTILRTAVASYLLLCLVARLGYPRMLFPAPKLDRTPVLDDPSARIVTLPHPDGSKGIAIHFPAPTPTARTVVVFHGNGETAFHNVDYGSELHRRGLGVLLVEYRGYGTTYGPSPTEDGLYEDGEAAIAFLKRELVPADRIALWGWSLGTSVAAEMASRGHGARLVLLAPFTSMTEMGKRFAPFLPVSILMKHRLDTLSKTSAIKQPTIVVHGDADELIPFAMGEAVARGIGGAKLVRVAGGHHADLLYPGSGATPGARDLLDLLTAHLE
jgi:fermentation-respiration switch protein FrsA (DUF1100 family)